MSITKYREKPMKVGMIFARLKNKNLRKRHFNMNSKQQTRYEDYIMVRTDAKSDLCVWMKLPPRGR